MKNLNLESFGVQEMDAREMVNVDGGSMGYDAGGYGLVYDRAKGGELAFYKGFFKGLISVFFD